jgi:hypothetical protein
MKLLFIFFPLFTFGQNLSNTPQIIYKAQATEVINASFMPFTEGLSLSVKSSQQVYDDNVLILGLHVLDIALDSGETIIAKGANIQYDLMKNGAHINYVATADNTLSNIRTLAQSAVGISLGSLTTAQVRALMAILLYKVGGVTDDGKVKALNKWAKE